jgi:hypothetical protein
MPALQFGISSYERAEGDLPALPVVNMYAEQTDSDGVVLQSRRGLADRSADMGTGPVRQLFKRDGVISGRLLGVSGNEFFDDTTDVGVVAGSGPVSIAGNEIGAMAAAGGGIAFYDGATLSSVAFPDDANVIKVVEGASRFVAIRANSARFYWTDPLGNTFGALSFATAESESDQLLDALFIDDTLVLFGSETVEFWPNTTDSLLPFQPLQGRTFARGIRQTGCVTTIGTTFAWVTDRNTVCIGDESNVVSNPGLQAKIRASTNVSMFNFAIDGRSFIAVRLDDETQVYNSGTGTWSEFASEGEANWLASCHAGGVFGSGVDGKTLTFGPDHEELGGVLERRFRAGLPINGGGIDINNLRLRTNPGQTPYLAGIYADATVEFRDSRDAGQTWSLWQSASLGVQGDYRAMPEWRALGLASQPGFLAEFRVADPVPFRVSGVLANEPYGGR